MRFPIDPHPVTFGKPDESANPDFLIQDLLPAGYLILLAGGPKEGKTCFATALALAVAGGTTFAGSATFAGLHTQRSSVLWLSLEESPDERALILAHAPEEVKARLAPPSFLRSENEGGVGVGDPGSPLPLVESEASDRGKGPGDGGSGEAPSPWSEPRSREGEGVGDGGSGDAPSPWSEPRSREGEGVGDGGSGEAPSPWSEPRSREGEGVGDGGSGNSDQPGAITDSPPTFHQSFTALPIDTPQGVAALEVAAEALKARLIVVDPLHAATSGRSLYDGWAARKSLQLLKQVCNRTGLTVLVLHHVAGRGIPDPRPAESQQLSSAASMYMVLEHMADSAWLESELSNSKLEHRYVSVACRGRGAFANRQWYFKSRNPLHYEIAVPQGTFGEPATPRGNPVEEAVLGCIEKGLNSAYEIILETGLVPGTVRNAITRLYNRAVIEVDTVETGARRYKLARVNDESDESSESEEGEVDE